MINSIKYLRQIIGVELNLGFAYIPAKAQSIIPLGSKKIKVKLGNSEVSEFTYNEEHKRIFGLTEWYKRNKIQVGSQVLVEIKDGIFYFNISDKSNKVDLLDIADKESDEISLDISGLSSSAKGNIVEDRIKELVLLYGQGLLNVYKPVVDNRGIDLIVMRDGVFMPIYLQIKSRFNVAKHESLLVEIRDNTFTAHHSFYIVGVSFNPKTLEIDDKILLIPSTDFEQNATSIKNYSKKRVTVSTKENSKAWGVKYFIRKSELVEVLMEKFEEMEKYLK